MINESWIKNLIHDLNLEDTKQFIIDALEFYEEQLPKIETAIAQTDSEQLRYLSHQLKNQFLPKLAFKKLKKFQKLLNTEEKIKTKTGSVLKMIVRS